MSLFVVGDTHLSGITRDESGDSSDAGLDEKNRPDNALQSGESVISSSVVNADGGTGGVASGDTIDATTSSNAGDSTNTNAANNSTNNATTSGDGSTTTTTTTTTTTAVDPIKDDGFCGYHCWSYYLTNPSFGNMREHFLGNTIVIQAIKELYPYYDNDSSSSSSSSSGSSSSSNGGGIDSSAMDSHTVTKFVQILESSGLRYPYTPLLRYLDLK